MKMFDNFKSMNMDELIEWLDKYCMHDHAPWMMWFDKNYCKKCFEEIVDEYEYGYCELNNKCKYFQDMDEIPSIKEIIKMWLECEV